MNVPISSIAKKTRDIVSASRTYSNRRNRKNKYSSGKKSSVRISRKKRRNEKESLCDRYE